MASESKKDVGKAGVTEDGVIPLHLLKNLRKGGTESGGSSNGENNSDNSALVSIGNTSFGFNFDSEEHTPNNSDRDRNENSEDSDDQQRADKKLPPTTATNRPQQPQQAQPMQVISGTRSTCTMNTLASSLVDSSSRSNERVAKTAPAVGPNQTVSTERCLPSHSAAAADAVANLQLIATSGNTQAPDVAMNLPEKNGAEVLKEEKRELAVPSPTQQKRKADDGDSSVGYHTDDEGRSVTMPLGSSMSAQGNEEKGRGKKKKRVDERKREERNLREKERSLRISKQINELRDLLSSGGVIVPKGTKSSVLTEAASYIRMLQQHQYRSELDRHQLIQQMQMIGNGAHGSQAARAIRHVAAQNGVWSLGNFGGVPPSSALSFYQTMTTESSSAPDADEQPSSNAATHPNKIENFEYKYVFNSCGVGIAIASLGGAFMDCNQLFCQLSNYTKQEICGLTIFNMTARQDLQQAFDLISQMISPPMESRNHEPKPIVLRGAMKNQSDIGLCVSLVRGEDGISRCFCVVLIKNPSSPFDTSKPIPISFDGIQQLQNTGLVTQVTKTESDISTAAPAFTLG